jgi:transcriptional regulator with XRE-family HTH domain
MQNQSESRELRSFDVVLKTYFVEQQKHRKLSLREFAFRLSVDPSTLHKIMNGIRKPSAKTIRNLGRKIGLPNEELEVLTQFEKSVSG